MTGRVFVSGGSGYIAGELMRLLLAQGWQVHTSIRNPARADELRTLLNVERDTAARIIDVLLMKNAG